MAATIETERIAEIVDELREITYYNDDLVREHCRVAGPVPRDVREAMTDHWGGELPADLDTLARCSSGISAPGWHLELPKTLDEAEPNWTSPIGRVYTIQAGPTGDDRYIEPTESGTRVWWRATQPRALVLCARNLATYLERRLSYVRQYRDAMASHRDTYMSDGERDEGPPFPDPLDRDYTTPEGRKVAQLRAMELDEELDRLVQPLEPYQVVFDCRHDDVPVGVPWKTLREHAPDASMKVRGECIVSSATPSKTD